LDSRFSGNDFKIMRAVVVNPTYNEAENIERLVERIQSMEITGWDLHQLVVDDSSPDHTGEIVKRLKKKYRKLHLITGEKAGLGAAYARGFKYAMQEMKADVLIEMDADFSHDPENLPQLLKEIDKGYDLVIGSRYVTGGSVPTNWGLFRKLNSSVANLFARYVAGLYKIRDVTAGFKAMRVAGVADQVNWDKTHAQGYSFQLMGDYYLLKHTSLVKEIPIKFVDRKYGQSKVGVNTTYLRDVGEFVRNAWFLRAKKTEVLLKFLMVGASGAVLNIILWRFLLGLFPGLNHALPVFGLGIAQFISGEITVATNFFLNNLWTFGGRELKHHWAKRLGAYIITGSTAVFIQTGVVILLAHFFGSEPRIRYPLIGIAIATAWNFLLSNYIIFKEKK
jgi:dolichol-phosphate mannosyltransferase